MRITLLMFQRVDGIKCEIGESASPAFQCVKVLRRPRHLSQVIRTGWPCGAFGFTLLSIPFSALHRPGKDFEVGGGTSSTLCKSSRHLLGNRES